MLTVVALYTLLSTTFCLNFTFAFTISSSSTTSFPGFNSSSSITPSTAASATPSTEHKHHKRYYEGTSRGYDETTHRIGIFVTSISTTTRRMMSTMTTTMADDDDDNEQFISSVRDLQIGFRKFLQFFNVEMEKNYQVDFLDYKGNYFLLI